jgi:hypothetical protein
MTQLGAPAGCGLAGTAALIGAIGWGRWRGRPGETPLAVDSASPAAYDNSGRSFDAGRQPGDPDV